MPFIIADYERHLRGEFTPAEVAILDDLIRRVDEFVAFIMAKNQSGAWPNSVHYPEVAKAITWSADSDFARLKRVQDAHELAGCAARNGSDDLARRANAWMMEANRIAYPAVNLAFARDAERQAAKRQGLSEP
jgi:hypothetical protein